MILGDYQRFECAYHLVIASQFAVDLRDALRAVELSMGELLTILHRIEWDGETRLFKIHENRLKLTPTGVERVRVWGEALRSLGIQI
jgi:hypothetical protein